MARSFSEAARIRGCTQATVSELFQVLENEVGAKLANHSPRYFQLTREGLICLEYSRQITRLADELQRQMRRIQNSGVETLELAASYSIGLHHLPPLLEQLQAAFPKIKIRTRLADSESVYSDVRENAVDLGLVTYPRRRRGLKIEMFRQEPLVLACHPEHPLVYFAGVRVSDLKHWPVISWTEIPWVSFLKNIRDSERHLLEPRHEFNEIEGARRAVEVDAGVAVLPEPMLRNAVSQRTISTVPFENGRHTQPLAVIHRNRRKLTPAMEKFIEFLKKPW